MSRSVIFGPVQSRRFGWSLGIDLSLAEKQCNYDCVYCELHKQKPQATQHNVQDVEEILEAISDALRKYPNTQTITLTANGEPTLYPHLYELLLCLEDIKGESQTLLLSNGSMLWDPAVAKACFLCDKVKFSLDAITQNVFKKIDRPQKEIHLEQILEGIVQFSQDFMGELFAEILFVEGINDTIEESIAMANFLKFLKITRVDLSTIDRPPAYKVKPITEEKLQTLQKIFLQRGVNAHIATRKTNNNHNNSPKISFSKEQILATLTRRPITEEEAKTTWDNHSLNNLQELINSKLITIQTINGNAFLVSI